MYTEYFDEDDFDNPIKKDIFQVMLNPKIDLSSAFVMNLQKNYVTAKDHWLSNSLYQKSYEFYKIIIG